MTVWDTATLQRAFEQAIESTLGSIQESPPPGPLPIELPTATYDPKTMRVAVQLPLWWIQAVLDAAPAAEPTVGK